MKKVSLIDWLRSWMKRPIESTNLNATETPSVADLTERTALFIEPWEGFSPVPYLCPASYWTIGFGKLCKPDHPPVTLEEARADLRASVPTYMAHALRLSPGLTGDRLVAITSFIFNLGPTRYEASTLRRRVNAGDWSEARVEIQRWVFGGGKKLRGLVLRRAAEAELL